MRLYEIQSKLSYEVSGQDEDRFRVTLLLDGKEIGTFEYVYDAVALADIDKEHQSKGYGKVLFLAAINTANDLNIPFVEDEYAMTGDAGNVFDSLESSNYIMQGEEDDWLITQDGYEYLTQHTS